MMSGTTAMTILALLFCVAAASLLIRIYLDSKYDYFHFQIISDYSDKELLLKVATLKPLSPEGLCHDLGKNLEALKAKNHEKYNWIDPAHICLHFLPDYGEKYKMFHGYLRRVANTETLVKIIAVEDKPFRPAKSGS